MKVLGDFVLVEQILTKKVNSKIILNDAKPEDELIYTQTLKVIEVGPDVKQEIKVGDIPILATWAEPVALKVISGKSGDEIITREAVYKGEFIVAIDNPQEL